MLPERFCVLTMTFLNEINSITNAIFEYESLSAVIPSSNELIYVQLFTFSADVQATLRSSVSI